MEAPSTRILLVDDDEDDYFITKDLLSDIRDWNPELDWAQDYDSALAVLARETHDVYLLDYRLGANDGLALMHEVFAHGRNAPVILLTGQDDPEVDSQAMKGGAADYLVKGQISSSQLERSIRYAVERNRTEEQLRQREEELRLTLENAPLGLFTCDLESRLLTVNPAFESIVGFSIEHLRNKRLTELIHPDWAEEWAEVTRRLIGEETAIGFLDRTFVCADEKRIEGVVTARLMRDRTGRPQQLVGQLEDVTGRRELERRLAQDEKLKSIGQLAAGVAHEINTPTQFVAHNLQFLEISFGTLLESISACREHDRPKRGEPIGARTLESADAGEDVDLDYLVEEIPRALEQSRSGIERISTIVRSVGALVRPDSRTCELVDLNRVVEATIVLTANQWKYVAEVATDLDPELPLVPCLPGLISQVVVNLLINAAQAIANPPEQAGDASGEIRISTRSNGDWAELCIADSGGGIPDQVRARIFDPFFTTKEVGQATGQGLAIAHNIVVGQHHGEILVKSEERHGATFTVRLPLTAPTRTPLRSVAPKVAARE